jgi:hypothetical protein
MDDVLGKEQLRDLHARIVRIETRLVQLMVHLGMDPYAKPEAERVYLDRPAKEKR